MVKKLSAMMYLKNNTTITGEGMKDFKVQWERLSDKEKTELKAQAEKEMKSNQS